MKTKEKVFVIKSPKGTFYVQHMVDRSCDGEYFRLMKNRKLLFGSHGCYCDFANEEKAIFALLEYVTGLYDPANQLNLV